MRPKNRIYMGVRDGVSQWSEKEQGNNSFTRQSDKTLGNRGREHANRGTAADDYYGNTNHRQHQKDHIDQNQARGNGSHRDRRDCEFS